jgi:hypothetical protein
MNLSAFLMQLAIDLESGVVLDPVKLAHDCRGWAMIALNQEQPLASFCCISQEQPPETAFLETTV